MMLKWTKIHPQFRFEMLGFIPTFLHEEDPRSASQQIAEKYVGGWHPFAGFKMLANKNMQYPEDPPTRGLAQTQLRDETIIFYDGAWIAVVQKDGSFEVSRVD